MSHPAPPRPFTAKRERGVTLSHPPRPFSAERTGEGGDFESPPPRPFTAEEERGVTLSHPTQVFLNRKVIGDGGVFVRVLETGSG